MREKRLKTPSPFSLVYEGWQATAQLELLSLTTVVIITPSFNLKMYSACSLYSKNEEGSRLLVQNGAVEEGLPVVWREI